VIAAVLCGGASRRFGADKAAVRIAGRTLLERVAGACAAAGLPVSIVGRPAPPDWAGPPASFLVDAMPGQGPLGGLATILAEPGAAGGVLAVGCDLPLLDAAAVRWLRTEAEARPQGDGVVSRTSDGLQPLFAVYRPSILPAVRSALADGRRAVHRIIAGGAFTVIDVPAGHVRSLADADTPEALAALLAGS
jgi:molybdopterin-guanine dinucleotide biosynthesis protein A